MPSFLTPSSNGSMESKRYDRLYYKVQPKPHFAIKKGDSDMTEEVNFKQLALDLSNMNIGYVKWLGTTPTKIMNSALDSMPPKPQGDGWNTLYELKVYSVNDLENMTAGEYAKLDEFIKDTDKNACQILNVLYRPIIKEKFYKTWFNKKDRGRYLIEPYKFDNDVSVFKNAHFEVYESVLVFFYNLGKDLTNATQNYMREAEQVQTIEVLDSGKNGAGFKHLIHTLQQSVSTLKKSNIKLSIKYYLD